MFHHCNAAGFNPAFRKQFYGQVPPFMKAGFGGFRRPKYNVPLNITESDTAYEVAVFATGFAKENIKVTTVDDVLYISGSKEISDSPNFTVQEFPIKNFERSLLLNGLVDTEQISAKVENGVLIVTLPKTPAAQKTETKVEVQ